MYTVFELLKIRNKTVRSQNASLCNSLTCAHSGCREHRVRPDRGELTFSEIISCVSVGSQALSGSSRRKQMPLLAVLGIQI